MANIKYFADVDGGETFELDGVYGMPNAEFATRFPGTKGRSHDSFTKRVGYVVGTRTILPVTRTIQYKAFPSKHDCDARCMFARGKTMNCECKCGGKNHGKGAGPVVFKAVAC